MLNSTTIKAGAIDAAFVAPESWPAEVPALQLFGAGREKRIYAIPPYTRVESLDFEDHPFQVQTWGAVCAICGDGESFLDEVITDDTGGSMFVCSDTDHCGRRVAAGHKGPGGPEEGE